MNNETHTSTETGGPAFPMPTGAEPRVDVTTHYNEGMTLLDYFAGQALAAVIGDHQKDKYITFEMTAIDAYAYAQAMLAERKRRGL